MEIKENAALIIVDVQQGFDLAPDYWGARNNPDAEVNMQRLLTAWRLTKRPVYHIKHNSINPNSPLHPSHEGNAHKPNFVPNEGEPLIEKDVNSAFIGTDLEQRLRDAGIEQVVIVGLTTNHCVSTTTRMAGNLGFDTLLVHDAVATHERTGVDGTHYSAQLLHDTAIATLHDEFATAVPTNDVLNAIIADAEA